MSPPVRYSEVEYSLEHIAFTRLKYFSLFVPRRSTEWALRCIKTSLWHFYDVHVFLYNQTCTLKKIYIYIKWVDLLKSTVFLWHSSASLKHNKSSKQRAQRNILWRKGKDGIGEHKKGLIMSVISIKLGVLKVPQEVFFLHFQHNNKPQSFHLL